MTTRHLAAIALVVTTTACGANGDGSGPTAPTLTLPIAGLSITPGADLIKLYSSEKFTAAATFSDGSARPVSAAWVSDNPAIATVDSTGRATGTASGQATIFADYQGRRATRLLRVVPHYHGLWRGDWGVTGCTDEQDWSGLCREFEVGSVWGLTVELTQNRDAMTGMVDFGRLPGPMSGTIRLSGHMVLSGTYTIEIEDGIAIEVTVSDWQTITIDNKRMTGRFRATMRAPWCQGSLSVDGELRTVVKTAAGSAPAGSASRDRALTQTLPRR